jgi:uncharacterized protein
VAIATLVLVVVAVVIVALGAVVWGLALLGAALVLGAVVERTLNKRFSSWGYLERSDDLLVRRGVLVSRLSVVPYGRMQFVDVTAGPLERSFGLATIRLHTAAAASDARIPGLERAEAARVRDQLSELGESHLAGL